MDQAPDFVFFVKDATVRYRSAKHSLVRRHGLRNETAVLGKRPCEICPGEFGQIPTQQDARLLKTGHPILDHLELHWDAPNQPGWCTDHSAFTRAFRIITGITPRQFRRA